MVGIKNVYKTLFLFFIFTHLLFAFRMEYWKQSPDTA